MSESATLDEFADEEAPDQDEQHQDREAEPDSTPDTSRSPVVFRLSNDQFVNEGIAELARRLGAEGLVETTPSVVRVADDAAPARVIETIGETVRGAFNRTTARTGTARTVNQVLQEQGYDQTDDRWVRANTEPFPDSEDDGGLTVYPQDTIDDATLEDHNLPSDPFDDLGGGKQLYTLAPEYVGTTHGNQFPNQVERFDHYVETLGKIVRGEAVDDGGGVCMCCGSERMPARKADGEWVEYNQMFAPLASSSGQIRSLGAGSRTSTHRGRCVACLVAGFYYALIRKLIRPTATDENDVRVFCPVGDLDQLVSIRRDIESIHTSVDPATAEEYPGRDTLDGMATTSKGMQAIEVYETVLRHLNREFQGSRLQREIQYRPTAFMTYISEVGRTRTIRAVETIDPEAWAYEAVSQQSFTDDQYWPVDDVLSWFGQLDEELIPQQDRLAFGVLDRDLERIERATFEFMKAIDQADDPVWYRPHPGHMHDYFTFVMNSATADHDRLDAEAIDSIRSVAASLGKVFHEGNDISVLIKLQNASTPGEFLQAFEKAAMQAQKKSLDDPPTRWQTSRDDNVATVLELIADDDTFDPTKRMFVIHASLAAQYENAVEGSDAESGDQTADAQADS